MANKEGFIKYVYEHMSKIDKNNNTPKILADRLRKMSKEDFHKYVNDIKAGKKFLPYYIPNNVDQKFDPEGWIKLCTSLGIETFTELVREDPVTKQMTLTDIKYWVCLLSGRRHLHHVEAKRTIPVDGKTRDTLTGQVTGPSKGTSFAKAQMGGLLYYNCIFNALELYKYRGGDISGAREFNKQLVTRGGVSLNVLLKSPTTTIVKRTITSYLNGMHFLHSL